MDQVEKASRRYRISLLTLNVLTCGFLLSLALLLLYEVTTVRQIAEGNETSNRILVECTTPGHACYDRAQEATAEAVNDIIQSIREDHKAMQRECGE